MIIKKQRKWRNHNLRILRRTIRLEAFPSLNSVMKEGVPMDSLGQLRYRNHGYLLRLRCLSGIKSKPKSLKQVTTMTDPLLRGVPTEKDNLVVHLGIALFWWLGLNRACHLKRTGSCRVTFAKVERFPLGRSSLGLESPNSMTSYLHRAKEVGPVELMHLQLAFGLPEKLLKRL